MDNRWKRFLDLAGKARDEQAPSVDVTHRVLASIASRRVRARLTGVERPMLYYAAGALLAASVVALLSSTAWIELNDPLSDLVAGLAVLNP